MIKVRINYCDLWNSVRGILQYISGKKAVTADEYFRFTVCEADGELLDRLMRESIIWMSLQMHKCWGGSEITEAAVILNFDFDSEPGDPRVRSEEISWLVFDILVYRMVFLWMKISGWNETDYWNGKSETLLNHLVEFEYRKRINKGLSPRRSFPFGNF